MSISTLARLLTSVVLFVVMARVWGAEAFGVFVYPFTIATIAVMVADYGFGLQVVKSIGSRPGDVHEVIRRALAAKWLLSVLVMVAVLVASPWLLSGSSMVVLAWLLVLSSLLGSFATLLNLPFRGLGHFQEETKVVVRASVIHFVLVSAAVLLGGGPVVAAVCFVISRAWYFLLSLSAYRRLIGEVRWHGLDARSGLAMLREGLPYGVFVAMGTLYFQIDTVLVQLFLGPRGVGLFQAGARLLMGALIVPEVISTVYLPAIAAVVKGDVVESARLGARMTRHLLMLGVIGMAVFALGAQWIVSGFYGRDYEAVVLLLPAFGLVLLLRFVASSYGLLLTVGDRQLARSGVVAGAFLVSLAVNILLIPRYGLRGAVLASVVTHVFLLCAYLWFVVREFGNWFLDVRGAALVALAGVVWLLIPAPPAVRIVGGLAIVAAAVVDGVKSAEWRRLAQTLPTFASGLELS